MAPWGLRQEDRTEFKLGLNHTVSSKSASLGYRMSLEQESKAEPDALCNGCKTSIGGCRRWACSIEHVPVQTPPHLHYWNMKAPSFHGEALELPKLASARVLSWKHVFLQY